MVYLQISYATAVEMNLKKGKLDYHNFTAYISVGEKCLFNCSFCSKARDSKSELDLLSRVIWPEVSMEEFKSHFVRDKFKRVCIQVISSINYWSELAELLNFTKEQKVKTSVSIRPKNIEEIRILFDKYEVDRVGIAVDVANEELFSIIKGGRYSTYEDLLIAVSQEFPNRITTHLIVGLGETDKDIVNFLLKMKKLSITVSLFAFTPVKGTKLENANTPDIERYRKIQYARQMILEYELDRDSFIFDENGNIMHLPDLEIDKEESIKTAGCSWCTRPFYNEKPGKELYNVPLPKNVLIKSYR